MRCYRFRIGSGPVRPLTDANDIELSALSKCDLEDDGDPSDGTIDEFREQVHIIQIARANGWATD